MSLPLVQQFVFPNQHWSLEALFELVGGKNLTADIERLYGVF